ncbi:peptidase family C54-domain-containing protein [Mycena latifolia]|nr:peptidase family C54-domain-containing protein [Mycena latifolia]
MAAPPTSPTTATPSSKLPRFLQTPAQRDRSKSLSVDRPASTTSTTSASTSNSVSTSSSGGGAGRRFLGLGKDKAAREREAQRQRVREREAGAPSAAELLSLQEHIASPTDFDFEPGSPPSAYNGGTARPRPRTRSERHFSASTPPSSTSSHSGHGGGGGETLQLARTPSRLGADGPLASRLSGWFAHLAGSTSDLSLAGTISGSLALASSTSARALGSSTSRARKSEAASSSGGGGGGKDGSGGSGGGSGGGGSGGGGSKTSLLDKAVRYLLDGDAAPDRSAADIWLMGVQLPGWGPADEARVAAAHSSSHGHGHSHHGHSHHGHGHAPADGAADDPDPGPWPARLLSWFLDAPAAPFSVHRMALAGKAAGKDVGMWFGPSAAAGAIRTLVDAFPACGLGVSVATDGTLYQTEVFAASHSPAARAALHHSTGPASSHGHGHGHARSPGSSAHGHGHASSGHHAKPETKAWGDRPVLLLLGIRLGLDGVNPVYHETIKLLYTFPQSVGIAGGRPSSSYYFIGVQGDGLFYLDPHHSRPTVPLRPFIPEAPSTPDGHNTYSSHATPTHAPDLRRSLSPEAYTRGGSLSPEPPRSGSMSPELLYARGGSMSPEYGHGRGNTPMTEDELMCNTAPTTADSSVTITPDAPPHGQGGPPLTPAEEAHFARAYSAAELRTFHCERVRKMPLSGLDPSMLLGFVCRDEREWVDLRRRVGELPRTIFGIQDEPPTWPGADDDDEMGLESISDPEEEAAFDDGDVSSASHAPASSASHAVSSASHVAASTFSHTHQHSNSSNSNSTATSNSTASSGEVDTEDDPVAPITPLPGARFDLSGAPPYTGKAGAYVDLDGEGDDGFVDAGGEAEIEDDWIDPVAAPPPPPSKKERDRGTKSKAKSTKGKKAVPVPSVHYPFPVSVEDGAGAGAGAAQERQERLRNVTVSPRAAAAGQRMHTARARDGGRTQSGGVRGVLTED